MGWDDLLPEFATDLGEIYHGDCVELMHAFAARNTRKRSYVFDMIFADPPFNLGKEYQSGINDDLEPREYWTWMKVWLQCAERLLAPGGSFFLYHVPSWSVAAAEWLGRLGLQFRHEITVKVTGGPPRGKGLYPSHYTLLYMTKGEPKTFRKLKVPIERCRHCGGELRDYGGHRHAIKEDGVSLSDIWLDIPSVRHAKYKADGWVGPQLSTRLLQRAVNMTTEEGIEFWIRLVDLGRRRRFARRRVGGG